MDNVIGIVVLYNYDKNVINNIKTYNNYCKYIIAVDNSDVENKELKNELLNSISNLKYISMNANTGIAYALNEGIKYSKEYNPKWILTMDQDSRFSNNLISIYEKYLDTVDIEKTAIFSPNYNFDRKKLKKYEGLKKKKYTMQSGNLLNYNLYNKIGKFKDEFFIDGVDYEYCIRATSLGYEIYEVGEAILNHTPAITKKKFFIKYGYCSPVRIYYQIRNLLWINKEYKNFKMILIIIMKFCKIILLFDNKKEYLKMFKKAIYDYKNNNYGKYSIEEVK